jgi:hypothetical protein
MTSQINPNNIDGAYPVPGQDNNSQGFRDNFTNTKTNFQYASDEITDLQNNALLKSALTGTTLDNNMNYAIISNPQLQGPTFTTVTIGNVSNATANVVYSSGSYQTLSTTGNVSLNFSGWPASGQYAAVRLQLTTSTANATVIMPSAVGAGSSYTSLTYIIGRPASSQTVTIANTGTYVFEFSTATSGASIFIQDLTRGANATPTA